MPEIYVSTIDRSVVWQFPALPEEFPTISQLSKNEEFATFNKGDFNLPGSAGLKTFSLGHMLPMHDYKFNRCTYLNTQNIMNFLLTSMVDKTPVRFVFIGENDAAYISINVLVEKFDYNFDKMLDVIYSGDFKEYEAVV